ncbi:NapC/NirT family cytochrome c [Cytobacillus spongiae]|jgi:cytochrome c nitrite reductase small subunit|uniref:cytochrome c3 family protein n=1 Tax=Cytobacillus spongiae TaxID=2901381 RepID=UPI001F460ACB|nr:NapC/NirT family cytochrome c [Cytobacillus spongiae]UII55268.1 NapC/NirT family cytochrome c [Cytobacillus spongiae]
MFKKLLAIDKKMLIFIGVFAGIIISAVTAKTFAYTDSADFCKSCHIMTNVHDSFTDSTHATLACNDCHLPHDSKVKKLVFKAKAGVGHMYFNTLGSDKIPGVLHATESSEEVIKENCISCHESTIDNVSHDAKESCTSCHQSIPHGDDFKSEDFYKQPKPGELLDKKGGTFNNG